MIKNGNEITITELESRTCLIDNKIFESNRKMIWHVRKVYNLSFEQYIIKYYYNGIYPICLKTGNPVSFKGNKLGPWFSNYSKNNFPRKPHSEESKKKIKEGCEKTNLTKYGVKNVFETNWCKEKSKQSLIENYGVDNIMKLSEYKEKFKLHKRTKESLNKAKETNLKKYNAITYSSSILGKLNNRKYGYNTYYNNWNKYITKLSQLQIQCLTPEIEFTPSITQAKFKCNVCSNIWDDDILIPFCQKCEDEFRNVRSKEEHRLLKWISENTKLNIEHNKRFTINEKIYEADIKIEECKLIIELNGLYWHSENRGKKDKNYHIDKMNAFNSLGYEVIQVFEDEWIFKSEIIKKKILHKLKLNTATVIHARKCIIKKITNKDSNEFLEKHHIQGGVNTSICYGAYFDNKLVSVMTFGKPRANMGNRGISEDGLYELVRFAVDLDYRINGIGNRLLNKFIEEFYPEKIYSYADRRFTSSKNNIYMNMGFSFVKETKPNYWYIKKYNREYRFNYTKLKLIKDGYDSNKTEWEIMKERGYDRIWDCGHLKYEWNKN